MDDMMKVLTRRSFGAGKARNLMAVLAIALTAVLFTGITTIVIGTSQSFTLTMQMQKMSRSDGELRYMTEDQFEALRRADFVKEAGLRLPVGFLSNVRRHNVELDVADEVQAGLTFCLPVYGRCPERANEVVASDAALRALGVEPEVGAEILIEFSAHGKEYTLPMVVSGWYKALNGQMSVMWAGTAFRDAYPEIFRYTYREDRELAGTYFSDFTVYSAAGLEGKLKELVYELGGVSDDAGAPD